MRKVRRIRRGGKVADYEEFRQLEERGYIDELVTRYSHLRRYLPQFLGLPFAAEPGSEHLLAAIDISRTCPTGTPLPEEASERVVPAALRPWLKKPDGGLDRRVWEIGLAMTVRDALKSGDLYLAASKRHVSFSNMIYNDARWAQEKPQAYVKLALPTDPTIILDRVRSEFEEVARVAEKTLSSNCFAEVRADGLHLHRGQEDRYQPSAAVTNLRRAIESQYPKVRSTPTKGTKALAACAGSTVKRRCSTITVAQDEIPASRRPQPSRYLQAVADLAEPRARRSLRGGPIFLGSIRRRSSCRSRGGV